tara:strand:+ start:1274 stop:2608 length:1335 start_codon:yes stop_codon:yes gene_type:complete
MSDFENGLKEMFEGAEFKPSDRVWAGVEAGIKIKKKKGVFFYWQTYGIAAGIALVLSFGFLFSDRFNGEGQKVTTKSKAEVENKESGVKNSDDNSKGTDSTLKLEEGSENKLENEVSSKLQASNSTQKPIAKIYSLPPAKLKNGVASVGDASNLVIRDNEVFESPQLRTPQRSINILKGLWDMKHMVASMDLKDYKIEEVTINESRALALNGGLSGGSFNPNPSGNSHDMFSRLDSPSGNSGIALSSVSNGSDKQLGSLSFGAGLGFELSDRWGINAGLRYSEYRFANQSNAYSVENGVSYPIYLPAGYSGEVYFIPNYDITNTIKSVSIPVQATFKVLDLGKFDVQMKAGFSADYFLSYNIKGDLSSLEVRKVAFSKDGLYDRLNFAGLSALALNYKLSQEWGVSVEGYYRKFLKPSNQDNSFQSSPSVLGVGFSLNYFINRD